MRPFSSKAYSAAILAATLLPLLYLIWAVFTYRIDAPFREQWYFMYVIEKAWVGTLQFHDLWQQEAEHRHPFPYLIMLALARLSHWNIGWELAANIVIATGSFVALAVQAARITGRPVTWMLPLLSVIVFNLSQFETWTWGFHLVTYLNIFSVVTGLVLLAGPERKLSHFTLALFLGVVACFSFASGFMYWVSGAVVVWLNSPAESRNRRAAAWGVTACLTAAVFFYGYRLPAWSAPREVVFQTPQRFVSFMLVSLGTPLFPMRRAVAMTCGFLGLVLLGFLSRYLLRTRRISPAAVSISWALAVYAVGTAALIASGRANIGDALSGRYTTTTSLLWIANVFLLGMALQPGEGGEAPGRQMPRGVVPAYVLLVLLGGGFLWRTVQGEKAFRWYFNRFKPAQDELYVLRNRERALPLFPPNPPMEDMVGKLREYRWGMFRNEPAGAPRS